MTDPGMITLALVALGSALGVVAFRNAVHSALSLTVNLLSLAVCFLTLGFEFLGAAQVLIYAGAIMVVFLFAVTLLAPKEAPRLFSGQGLIGWGALATLLALAGALLAIVAGPGARPAVAASPPFEPQGQTVEAFSALLLGPYALPFEATAFVLLTAVIGAAILGKGRAVDGV